MNLFHIIDNVQCITISRGVYRQEPVFFRDIELYVKHGSDFIKLLGSENTSAPYVRWIDLSYHNSIDRKNGKWKASVYCAT